MAGREDKPILLMRFGEFAHAERRYTPPEVRIRKYIQCADIHDGKVLFTTGSQVLGPVAEAGRLIISAAHSPICLIGDVVDAGSDYSPDTWLDRDYRLPRPWDGEVARYWICLDNVQILEGFDPAEFETTGGWPLDKKLQQIGFCAVLVRPRRNVAISATARPTGGLRITSCLVNRFALDENAGREFVRLDDRTEVTYNNGTLGLVSIFQRHAERSGGRVLVPLTANVAAENIDGCDEYLILAPNGRWMRGRIEESGADYEHGLQDGEDYTVPPEFVRPTAKTWVSLSHVTGGSDGWPDVSQWYVYRRAEFRRAPLTESLELGRFSAAIAYKDVYVTADGARADGEMED